MCMRMRTCSKPSLGVYSLKLHHSFFVKGSTDSSHLSIISAIRSARSFANGFENNLSNKRFDVVLEDRIQRDSISHTLDLVSDYARSNNI